MDWTPRMNGEGRGRRWCLSWKDVQEDIWWVKVRCYVLLHPVFRTAQSALHVAPWWTCSLSHLLWEIFTMMTILYKYPPMSIARYSCIQLDKLEQCEMKETAEGLTQQHIS